MGPEILPPEQPQHKSLQIGRWTIPPRTVKAIKYAFIAGILSWVGWSLQNFLSLRGVMNLLASRINLGFIWLGCFVVGWMLTVNVRRKILFRASIAVVLLLVVWSLDLWAPKPNAPVHVSRMVPLMTMKLRPSAFPVSVPPRTTLHILPLHPFQTFTDAASQLHEYDNECSTDHPWPSEKEISSKPANSYEEVRAVEITNHGPGTLESGRIVFGVRYNQSYAGGCVVPPQSAQTQDDVVSIPTLDQGQAFAFISVNQTDGCAWLLPPDTIRVKMAGDESENNVPLKMEPISVPNWVGSPFGPTAVKWEGVPTQNPGYGIVRSGASCQTTTDHGLRIMYGNKDLDGQTIPVMTRYMTVDGKTIVGGQEVFALDAFRVKNLNARTTGDISAQLYLSKDLSGWNPTSSDEGRFRYSYNMVGGYAARINAQQTVSIEPYYGMTKGFWPVNEIVSARLKIFYGADKPATADFRIRKIGVQQ